MELLLSSCYGGCAGLDVTDIFRSLSPEVRKYLIPWEAFRGSHTILYLDPLGRCSSKSSHSSKLLLLTVSLPHLSQYWISHWLLDKARESWKHSVFPNMYSLSLYWPLLAYASVNNGLLVPCLLYHLG